MVARRIADRVHDVDGESELLLYEQRDRDGPRRRRHANRRHRVIRRESVDRRVEASRVVLFSVAADVGLSLWCRPGEQNGRAPCTDRRERDVERQRLERWIDSRVSGRRAENRARGIWRKGRDRTW